MGPRAVLVEFADLDTVMAVSEALRCDPPPGVVDVVPAMRTVLVTYARDADVDVPALRGRWDGLDQLAPSGGRADDGAARPVVVLPVRYDGADLASVAEATGCSVDEVVALHTGATYRVAFCGFRPGFAYLVGLHPALHLPRRADPRPHVPAGSVAIAASFSAVYPSPSPGGWHLLGRTDAVLWDETAPSPALLPPGTLVRFEAR